MKKILLLLPVAALLLAGCAKEQAMNGDGEKTVSISVGLPGTSTKAAADNDGNAVKANHWIMEVRDSQGALFYREEKTPETGTLTQTFKVSLIKNQSYNLLFWADNNGGFYNTDDLTNVRLTEEETYTGNNDSRDAFTACKAYTASTNEKISVSLYRPFAQVNIITTDLETLWEQAQTTGSAELTYLKFEPSDYAAVVKVPTSFNVKTQQCGEGTSDVTITADKSYCGYRNDKETQQDQNNYRLHTNPATLFMDYIFASKSQKDIVDIAFSFSSNERPIEYTFNAIPVQANYRTNIKGKMLSYDTEWVVEIKPAWETTDYDVEVFETSINNIEELNSALASNEAAAAKEVKVTTTMPTDSNEKAVVFTSVNNEQVVNLNFEGTLGTSKTISFTNEASAEGPVSLNIVAPSGTKLKFNNPMTHVVINGETYDNVSGTFSANSLIIEKGVTVNSLTIDAGGLEIHGTVNTVAVNGTKENVFVRACEGLSKDVYEVLEPFIAEGYEGKCNGCSWDIIPADNWINYASDSFLSVEGKNITINSAEQLALLAKKVLEGNTYAGYTISLGANIDLGGREWTPIGIHSYRKDCDDKQSTVNVSRPFNGTFDGNGHTISNLTISVADNGKAYNGAGLIGYMTEGSVKNLTVSKPAIEGRLYVGAIAGFPYTGAAIENCHVSGDIQIVASWYCGGIAGNGYIKTIKDCSVNGEAGSFIKGNANKYADGAAGYFGGIIGFRGEGAQVVENCSVNNIEITAECNGLGGITGLLHYGNTVKNCSLNNVTLTLNSSEKGDIDRLGLYAGGNNGTAKEPGWCYDNNSTACTVSSNAGDCSALVGAAGTGMPDPTCVIGNGVLFDDEGRVIGGTFHAIPATVVGQGYKIVANGDLYDVVESEFWIDHAAKEYAAKDPVSKTITIATPAQLALFRNELANSVNYEGYTVTLSANIDLGAYIWDPITGLSSIVFDGGNKTISNMTVNKDAGYGNAFISYVYSSTVKNVTFDNAKVTRGDKEYSGNVYAVVAAYAGYYQNATFENVTVRNSYVSAYGKIGAIAAMAEMQGNTLKFKDCKVENTTLKGAYNVGGLIGLFHYQVSGARNTIKIENSDVDYTFVPAEIPDRNFTERTSLEGLEGYYLVNGKDCYAESAKYYCEYNTTADDKYNADAIIHNNPDNIIP